MSETHGVTEVADGIYRCGSRRVNWYLIREEGAFTVVDTGFPTHYPQLFETLATLGAGASDIGACLLTHAHPDHLGFARKLHEETGVPVKLHPSEIQRARAGGDPPIWGFVKNIWRPAVLAYFLEIAQSKGTAVPAVTSVDTFEDGAELDVPGRPTVIHVPGHTEGEVVFYLSDRDALLCGDALATADLETWRGHRPQLLPAWVNADHDRARQSLGRLEELGDVILLPGHGDPWSGDMAEAVRIAQRN